MKILTLEDMQNRTHTSAVTIGNFDGLHLGHRQLIRLLVKRAQALECPSVVVTFSPHPVQVLRPELGLRRLFPIEDLVSQLEQERVSETLIIPFDNQLSLTSASDFLENTIIAGLNPKHFVIGYDFRFGRERSGDIALLKRLGMQYKFSVERANEYQFEGQTVSSTLIRQSLKAGDVQLAAQLLGRPFSITGKIVKGRQLGRSIGFPTANFDRIKETLPGTGVYICESNLSGKSVGAIANIGYRPTVEKDEVRGVAQLEVHYLDFAEDLYGKQLNLRFLHRLRDEIRFENLAELSNQIEIDEKRAREWLSLHRCK